MKRISIVLFLVALCGAFAFAAERVYCKWCGTQGALQQMVVSYCSRSPTHKHEPYEGAARRFYVCKFCAFESPNFQSLVISPCSKSPSKYHQAYEGTEKKFYTCKYCGTQSNSFKQLVNSPCSKSPRKYHDAL